MVSQKQRHSLIGDFLRLIRAEDYTTFVQVVIGFFVAGGKDGWHLAGALIILAPCIYGGLYTLNDVRDALSDRLHPIKNTRPVAAGRIKPRVAVALGVVLIGIGLVAAFLFDFKTLILAFTVINLAYTFKCKSLDFCSESEYSTLKTE